ncbi:hypothetical protein [Sphingomonas sp. UYP23]
MGATGARPIVTLLGVMQLRDVTCRVATFCIVGGGVASAGAIERVEGTSNRRGRVIAAPSRRYARRRSAISQDRDAVG